MVENLRINTADNIALATVSTALARDSITLAVDSIALATAARAVNANKKLPGPV